MVAVDYSHLASFPRLAAYQAGRLFNSIGFWLQQGWLFPNSPAVSQANTAVDEFGRVIPFSLQQGSPGDTKDKLIAALSNLGKIPQGQAFQEEHIRLSRFKSDSRESDLDRLHQLFESLKAAARGASGCRRSLTGAASPPGRDR